MEKPISFASFSKEYWWIYVTLVSLLVVPVFIYCWVFITELRDVSAWASIIAGIATYLGAAFLGILVYYNSWVQTELSNRLDEINVIINTDYAERDGHLVPFSKEEVKKRVDAGYIFTSKRSNRIMANENPAYVQFSFHNNNVYTPIAISLEGIYYLDDKMKLEKCELIEIARSLTEDVFFDFHSPIIAYYGISSDILKQDYYRDNSVPNIVFVFKIVNTKGAVKYYVADIIFHGSVLGNPRFLSEKQYIENISKHGCPIAITPFNLQVKKLRGTTNEI